MTAPQATKPRVLIVTGVLWIGGGAEKVAAALGNHLTDQGYETHLLTFYEAPEKYEYHGIYHSFNEAPKSKLQKVFRVPQRIWKIARYAKQHDIDIAYTFLEEANFYVLAAKLLFHRRLPVIVSVRNNIEQRGWLFKKLSAWLYPHAKCVVSVTRVVEDILQRNFGLTNTTTIYNPLDMATIEAKQREPLPAEYEWLSNSSPLLITIGRLISQKGQWHLIRAFSEVRMRYPDATLAIVGGGEYEAKLRELIEHSGLSECVHLLGVHPNVYRFLATADVFVFSSRWEGMPNTMLEALAVGLPIITPDCPSGPREIIAPALGVSDMPAYPLTTPYGILTAPFDPAAEPIWQTSQELPLLPEEAQLANAMRETLEHGWFRGPEHTAHRERIAAAFSYRKVMAEWEELLK